MYCFIRFAFFIHQCVWKTVSTSLSRLQILFHPAPAGRPCEFSNGLFETMLHYFNTLLNHFANVSVYLNEKFPEVELLVQWVHTFLTLINTAKLPASRAVPLILPSRMYSRTYFLTQLPMGCLKSLLTFANLTGESGVLIGVILIAFILSCVKLSIFSLFTEPFTSLFLGSICPYPLAIFYWVILFHNHS